MSNETLNDDILFDRLVDGELAGIERRRLLESLDTRPDGWRRCALAFLEAQSWREDLGQDARGVRSVSKDVAASPPPLPSEKPNWASRAQWFALAASVMLAFGLGWMERGRASFPAGGRDLSDQIAGAPPQVPTAPPKTANPRDAITLYVRDDAGKLNPVRVPLVDAGTLDKQLGVQFQTGLPDAMRDGLKDRGYELRSKRQYAPLWLENGRSMIVPVEDTKIVPAVY